MSDAIRVRDLTCSYGKYCVLEDISLSVQTGDLVFLLGNNGCGKTTLVKCILNMIPYSGSVFVKDNLTSTFTPNKFAKLVSYVPQSVNISCDYSVKDYLLFGRNPYIRSGRPQQSDYAVVDKFASQTGVQDYLNKSFQTLSGGQKQLVAITRALVQETPIIIMDEPMSALDLGNQADILQLLMSIKSEGKTLLMVSHNPLHALSSNGTVCLLDDRHIFAYGPSNEILSDRNIKQIYGNKIKLHIDSKTFSFEL